MRLAPSFGQTFLQKLFTSVPSKKFSLWKRNHTELFTFSRGTEALLFLAQSFYLKNKRMPVMALPDLYCRQSLDALENYGVKLVPYAVGDKFEVNLDLLPSKIDFFLYTNYFGNHALVETVKNYCKRFDIILIDDCAHLLKKDDEDIWGDISLFTPYKILSVPDGAILLVDKKLSKKLTLNYHLVPNVFPDFNDLLWILKKIIVQFIPLFLYRRMIRAQLNFNYDDNDSIIFGFRPMKGLSYFILSRMNEDDLISIQKRRMANAQILSGAVRFFLHGKDFSLHTSFYGHAWNLAILFKNSEQARQAHELLIETGLLVQTWPSLKTGWGESAWQAKRILVLPIHQDLNLFPWLQSQKTKWESKLSIKQITEIDDLENQLNRHNLLQSSYYGELKLKLENKTPFRYLIYHQNRKLAYFQVLQKEMGPFSLFRINRGPVSFENENPFVAFLISSKIKKIIGQLGRGILVWAPEFRLNIFHQKIMQRMKFYCFKESDSHTIWLDLTKSEELLRKSLHSKWRNCLVKAEQGHLQLQVTKDISLDSLILEYLAQQKKNEFEGLPTNLLNGLLSHQRSTYVPWLFQAYIDNTCVAQIVVCQHGKSATYLIGLNSDQGRKTNANYFLLWKAMLKLKESGIESFDLGGLGIKKTPHIAAFKRGLGGDEYHFSGEYVGVIL